MVYTVNQPNPSDNLSVSAPILRDNTNTADTYFGVDHYAFSAASNNGLHKQVTTLAQSHPAAPVSAQCLLYGAQDSSVLGVLQYTRGNNSGPPTPVTTIQSTSAAGGITIGTSAVPVLDFSGLTLAICYFTVSQVTTGACLYSLVNFSSGNFTNATIVRNGSFSIDNAGNTLQVTAGSSLSNCYWTVQFLRIVV